MDGIKGIDKVNNDIKTTTSETDTTYNVVSNSSKVNNDDDINQIENTESYQNIPNTFSINDVETVDLSIFEE